MDETLYLFFSALLVSVVVWLLNPFGKLHMLMNYLLRRDSGMQADLLEGIRSFEEMPGPKGLPILGDLLNFLRNSEFKPMMAELKSLFGKYGPIFKRNLMGATVVCVKDPKDVEVVLKADGKYPVRPMAQFFKVDKEYKKSRNLPEGLASL